MTREPFTSHTIPISKDISYFYTDSGAPPSSKDYTTLLVIHGSAFTGESFTRLHQLAPANNLRTILLNRRDYPGSSPFEQFEVDDWNAGRPVAWDRLGIQLAQVILKLVREERLPRTSNDRKSGGVIVMGWSMGTSMAMSLFLPAVREYLGQAYSELEGYVRDLVMYDPPTVTLGYPLAEDTDFSSIYLPWLDYNSGAQTAEEAVREFSEWVTSYYDHPHKPASVNDMKQAKLKKTSKATLNGLSEAEYRKWVDIGAPLRSETKTQDIPEAFIRVTSSALFSGSPVFPAARVTYIAPTRTPWICYWAYVQHERIYNDRRSKQLSARETVFIEIEGGNHCVHWDSPDLFMDAVLTGAGLGRAQRTGQGQAGLRTKL